MVTAKVIDMEALRRSAFEGRGDMAMVSRTWLQDVFAALKGAPFVEAHSAPSTEASPAEASMAPADTMAIAA